MVSLVISVPHLHEALGHVILDIMKNMAQR